jgi:hypothetical protein
MARRKKKSKFVSGYFDQRSRYVSGKNSSIYTNQYYYYDTVGTVEIRKIAEEIFGSPYGFKAKQDD